MIELEKLPDHGSEVELVVESQFNRTEKVIGQQSDQFDPIFKTLISIAPLFIFRWVRERLNVTTQPGGRDRH